jgi:hypothetical protein
MADEAIFAMDMSDGVPGEHPAFAADVRDRSSPTRDKSTRLAPAHVLMVAYFCLQSDEEHFEDAMSQPRHS